MMTLMDETGVPFTQKWAANNAVQAAVKKGTLVRQPCQVCGAARTHGHHYLGYSDEHRLDVIWLCARHHREAHGKTPQTRGEDDRFTGRLGGIDVVNDVMSLADAARSIGLKPQTLAFQARLGVIQTYRMARTRLVTKEELARYVREHQRKKPGEAQ